MPGRRAALPWAALVLAGCGGSGDRAGGGDAAPLTADRCVLRLHGKGGDGAPTTVTDGVADIAPAGNGEGWGGRQWLYFPDAAFDLVVGELTAAVGAVGCTAVVVDGFSNGAALAAKLYCRGETLGGVVTGFVIDDPVPDHGAEGCDPVDGVAAALYWTGALADRALAGADCAALDWTCEGGDTVGIDRYAQALGLPVQPSPHADHEWYRDPPEIERWLGAG